MLSLPTAMNMGEQDLLAMLARFPDHMPM